ncbi:MAG: hypothetical protein ACHQUC_02410 [Chlamydiales bacterium]
MATAILHHPIVTDALFAGAAGFVFSGVINRFESFKFSALIGVITVIAVATLELLTLKFGILVAGTVCGAGIGAFLGIVSCKENEDCNPIVTIFKGAIIGFALGALIYGPS